MVLLGVSRGKRRKKKEKKGKGRDYGHFCCLLTFHMQITHKMIFLLNKYTVQTIIIFIHQCYLSLQYNSAIVHTSTSTVLSTRQQLHRFQAHRLPQLHKQWWQCTPTCWILIISSSHNLLPVHHTRPLHFLNCFVLHIFEFNTLFLCNTLSTCKYLQVPVDHKYPITCEFLITRWLKPVWIQVWHFQFKILVGITCDYVDCMPWCNEGLHR